MLVLTRLAFILALLTPAGAVAQADGPANYAVTVSGDTLRTEVEFEDPLIGTSYVSVAGERRELEEFSELHLDGVTNAVVEGRRLAPLLTDGKVRFYARTVSTPGTMVPGPNGGMVMSGGTSSRVGYVQLANGPVLKATHPVLQDALSDNPESLRHLGRAQTLRTAGWITTGLGIAAFIGGAALSFDAEGESSSTPQFSPVMIGGVALAATGAYVLPGMADSARDRAIEVYNAE